MSEKRQPETQLTAIAPKRTKELVIRKDKQIYKPLKRTSLLSQPIMQLSGHSGPVTTCQFANGKDGKFLIASSGADAKISTFH